MGRETTRIPFQTPILKRRNARIKIKACENVSFEAPTAAVETDSCLLHPFDTGAASPSDAIPTTPLLTDLLRLGAVVLPRITFRGWTPPGLGWEAWVRDMASDEKIVAAWRKAGIEDAVMGSVANIMPDRPLMEALFGFWCSVTRTFMFPWGEAAFTLEDAHVIGRLPISGSRLDRVLTDEEEDLSLRLFVEKEKIRELHPKAKATRKVTLDIWLQWFLELQGEEELKHIGFLAYWLAKNVVPSYPAGEVPKVVFGLAARLSCGDQIALAPLVTANMYHDLSKISTSVLRKLEKRRGGSKIETWAQFGLLQAWVWERFERLRLSPQGAGPSVSESHISRWGSRRSATRYNEAIHLYQDEKSYTWRPYSRSFGSWKEPPWNDQETRIVHVEEGMPDWMHDYMAIISPSILQGFYGDGLISSERYQPHRVARQFGYDQAIPVSNVSFAISISNNVRQIGQCVSIPKITRCGNPRRDYRAWWKKHKVGYQKALNEYAKPVLDLVKNRKTKSTAKDKVLANGVAVSRTSSEVSYERRHYEGQENKDDNDLMVEPRADKTKHFIEENKQLFSLTVSQGGKSGVKVKGYDTTRSKSLSDEMYQSVERKRKAEVYDTSRNGETLSVSSEEVVVIDDDSDEDVDFDKQDRRLVDELEEFQRCGLLNEWEPSSPEPENGENIGKYNGNDVRENEDPYGHEAIRMYPQFFVMVPQKPHYRGLLDDRVSEEVRKDVYLAKWYRLVDLMRKTLQTTCQTEPLEIENLMMEARKFEGFGFNVKHIIARLKEPQARLRRLKEAKLKLEEAKSREQQAIEMENLKKHITNLGSKLRVIEKRLEETQEAIGMTQLMNLRKEVENAETNLRVMEHDVEAINDVT
ncbi:unnamed protein product [Musa hybrid cultivar]